MSDDPDPREGPLHPRLAPRLIGHEPAERALARAFHSGRSHHAWLICGPRGIGKATLAYRFAKYVLCNPERPAGAGDALEIDATNPAVHRVAARGHADLLCIEREFDEKTRRLKSEIGVDRARAASAFFGKTAAEGGWRVCIIDAADDLNVTAANSILKILEEPPARTLFLLVCHAPGSLLPTIRSRCIELRLSRLTDAAVQAVLDGLLDDGSYGDEIVRLAAGSPGSALQLVGSAGAKSFASFEKLVSGSKGAREAGRITLANQLAGRDAREDYDIFCRLLQGWLMQQAKEAALRGAVREAADWAAAHQEISYSIHRANALNLDRQQVMLAAFSRIEQVSKANAA